MGIIFKNSSAQEWYGAKIKHFIVLYLLCKEK